MDFELQRGPRGVWISVESGNVRSFGWGASGIAAGGGAGSGSERGWWQRKGRVVGGGPGVDDQAECERCDCGGVIENESESSMGCDADGDPALPAAGGRDAAVGIGNGGPDGAIVEQRELCNATVAGPAAN